MGYDTVEKTWMNIIKIARAALIVLFTTAAAPLAAGAEQAAGPVEPPQYGWWSVVPPLTAIVLAIVTRRVVASLLLGILAGAWVLADGHPLEALRATLLDYLWNAFADADHFSVFAFTLLMGSMVGVVQRSGGMHALVRQLSRLANTRRRGQLMTWLLGMLIFFDDYANSLLLGTTMQPMGDRLKISREKLAYLVDSTAAPVAGLALISTWVAGEVGYIETGFRQLGPAGEGFDAFVVFVETIPYRFYALWALVFVALVGWLDRDFGPMLAAERAASQGPVEQAERQHEADSAVLQPQHSTGRHWALAVVPIAVVVLVVLGMLVISGFASQPSDEASVWQIIGAGNSFMALVYGALAGWLCAVWMARYSGACNVAEIRAATGVGAQLMTPALAVLWLAWTLSSTTDEQHLGTARFLAGLVGDDLSTAWLPTLGFLLAGVVAFSTGTSWGTMGILMPLVVQFSFRLLSAEGVDVTPQNPLLLATIGGVLAGAIFGDHCSPISDTTVLSSRASGCDHIAHVRTQMPYAVLVGVVAVVCGTLPVGWGFPVWPLHVVALIVLIGSLLLLGRRAASDDS